MAIAAAVASVFAASLAFAQAQPSQPAQPRSQAPERRAADQDQNRFSKGLPAGMVKASDLVGQTVENQNGDNLGKIEDLLIDPKASRVDFAIFQPGGKFFSGTEASRTAPAPAGAASGNQGVAANERNARDDYYAVPVSLFSESGKKLILSADRAKITSAPHFAKDKWPDLGDAGWREDVYKHYGVSGKSGADKLVRAHDFLKKDVRNAQNEKLGSIQDVVVELKSGRVLYAVLDAGGFLGMGDKLFAVPLTAFTPSPDGKDYVVQASKDQIKNAKGFEKNSWPATASRDWMGGSSQMGTTRSTDKKS
jgi:sporulation protein YlmC with PRC-barrel domain